MDIVQDEQNGPAGPFLDIVNGFGTMSYAGYRDGGAQAPPSFNNRGEFGMNLAWGNLMELQGDGLDTNDGSRIHIRPNMCIESDDPGVIDTEDGLQ